MEASARFELTGKFLGFEGRHHDAPKRLLLLADNEEHSLKIAKGLRQILVRTLTPGAHLRVSGKIKWDSDRRRFKRKAQSVHVLPSQCATKCVEKCGRPAGTIQLCGKKNCWNKGGELLWHALEQAIDNAGLKDTVVLEKTGCLKNCRHRPSLLCSPGGQVCGPVCPKKIPAILAKHFPTVRL